ncbi:hypothetical protein QFC19_001891 [Naganishia cerealis]|uniref:Uncharacterized protein n=1 Tax=Naganishia cerealis TaxID=610337 RepID=A0ACC2WER6_9TREE|nr:hypothetical protein QFC19_001891 [Naganishia cerealis]
MTGDEVGRVQAHFDNLYDEFSSRLAEHVRSQTSVEPNTSPPSSVRLVVLELSRKEDGDKDLEDASLHSNDRNHAQHDMGGVPKLEPPHKFKECNETDNGAKVSDGSHDSSELVRVSV